MATAFIYGSMVALAIILGIGLSGWARSKRYKRRPPHQHGRAIELEMRGRMRQDDRRPGERIQRHA